MDVDHLNTVSVYYSGMLATVVIPTMQGVARMLSRGFYKDRVICVQRQFSHTHKQAKSCLLFMTYRAVPYIIVITISSIVKLCGASSVTLSLWMAVLTVTHLIVLAK